MSDAVIIRRKPITPFNLAESTPIHPVLQRIYENRGVASVDDINRSLKEMLTYDRLSGLDKALEVLTVALTEQQKILIIGDFDADGATSTAVAVRGLKMLGAKHVEYLVPNRFEYGYGLSPEIVVEAAKREPNLIITVDNGIANHDGVIKAKSLGIKVLITDHHLPADSLPPADAIVNPNLATSTFPSKNLAGVGVIFYVLLALRAHLREERYFIYRGIKEPNLANLLDLVALGTVADVVPLDKNNRILVHQGLMRIRNGKCCAGIKTLIDVSKRNSATLSSQDLGFALGPRLNAAGRLDDMSIGIQCLLTDKFFEARRLSAILNELNRERREIESNMKEEALEILNHIKLQQTHDTYGICVYEENWHQGVIGIVAARLKESFHRPVIAFAKGGEGEIKGSARSVNDVHIRDVLDRVDKTNPGLIEKFGGHAMAAGLTIKEQHYERFAESFNDAVKAVLPKEKIRGEFLTDGELTKDDLNLELATMLRDAGPWGQGFPEPLFDGKFKVLKQNVVGEKHLKLHVSPDGKTTFEAIAFNVDFDNWSLKSKELEMVYRLDINEYAGKKRLQLVVEHMR